MAHPCCGHGDRRRLPFVPRTVVTRGKGWGRVGRGVGITRCSMDGGWGDGRGTPLFTRLLLSWCFTSTETVAY